MSLNKLYSNLTYFDEYGGSVFLFVIINILAIYLHVYIYTLSNMNDIRANWQSNRCRPHLLPFAGIINDTGELSTNEYTQNNLQYCAQEMLASASGKSFGPIAAILTTLGAGVKLLFKDVAFMAKTIVGLEMAAETMFKQLKQNLMRFIIPLKLIFLAIQQLMLKTQGVVITLLYFLIGGILTGKSILGAILQLAVMSAITIFVALVVMLVNPFTAVIGLSMIAPFAIMEAVLITFVMFSHALGVDSPTKLPKFKFPKPKKICFHPKTKIILKGGEKYSIQDIPLGSILKNGAKVEVIMKLDNDTHESLYKLGNVFVTGSHYVKSQSGKYIHVENHPSAIKQTIVTSDYFICLITSDHTIQIDEFTFWDWEDDLFEI